MKINMTPFSRRRRDEIEQYVQAAKDFSLYMEGIGYPVHLQFGALVGCARDGTVPPTDNDIDFCFLSKFKTKAEVRAEFADLLKILKTNEEVKIKDYWNVNLESSLRLWKWKTHELFGQAHIFWRDHFIDLFASWIDENGDYWTCQWGNFGPTGFEEGTLEGIKFTIPSNYDKILTRLYGDWREPKKEKAGKRVKRQSYLKD